VAVTVLLVDDMPELRAVLRQRLHLSRRFRVVAEAGDGTAAIDRARRYQPDVVVLDLGLPDLAGHEVLTRLRAVARHAQVVVYTGSVRRDEFALSRDVDAYVSKSQDVSYLVDLLVELTARGRRAATLEVGPRPADVRLARRFLAAHCERWGCDPIVDDAEIVVTELVTNAFVHAATTCRLALSFSRGRLRIEVRDEAEGAPDPQAPDTARESGRGLLLVSAMADAWGVEPLRDGKVVWADLRLPAGPGGGGVDRRPGGSRRARDDDPAPFAPPGGPAAVPDAEARAPLSARARRRGGPRLCGDGRCDRRRERSTAGSRPGAGQPPPEPEARPMTTAP
jgi:CheY-like chemotaxis protein/anti-sigma regulatory factor (Ser/Thr protein kinase)